ncbi:MAG: hypothetical protein M1812_001664 [Candelaria pacifica]|nr:MAG: hypothetical protein M1812_001664 [Candelaria pacifica]
MAKSAGGLSAIPDHTTNLASGLQPPTHDIRMPFSSPIGEEICSPLSPIEHSITPNKDYANPFASPFTSHNPFLDDENDEGPNPYASEHDFIMHQVDNIAHAPQESSGSWAHQASRAAARSASAKHSQRYSVGKPGREASRKKQPSRIRRPGITVITDFAQNRRTASATEVLLAKRSMTFPQDRPVAEAVTDAESTRADSTSSPRQHRPAIAPKYPRPLPPVGFVNLADLKALDAQAGPSRGFKWPRMGKEPKTRTQVNSAREDEAAGESTMLGRRETARVKGAGFKSKTMRPRRQAYNEIDDKRESPSLDPAKRAMGIEIVANSPENALALEFEDGRGASRRLRPPPIKLEEDLSPSDRPIVIGLSVPSARLEEHTLSPLSASVASSAVTAHAGRARAPSDANSVTPTIIITPARETSGWSIMPKAPSPPSTRRIASSIYSQPTPYIGGAPQSTAIPPMPAVPANIHRNGHGVNPFMPQRNEVRDSANTLFEEDQDEKTPIRAFRSQSSSESDHSPQLSSPGRSFSGTSALSPGNRSSVDTTATRRRSRGWWNFITTPFVTRSNTALTKGLVGYTNQRPEIPSLAQAADELRNHDERDEKGWDKQFSPASSKPKSGHTTMWTDLDWWEEDREKIGVAVDHTPRASVSNHKHRHKPQDSSATIPFMMAGGVSGDAAAAEYYSNGHRTLGSNNPFNQDRLPGQDARVQSRVTEPRQSQLSSFSPNDREVPMLFEGDHHAASNHDTTNPFYQAPSDPFASSFRQVAPPTSRPRPDSGMTVIEVEDEVVVSPTVHEARVAPVVVARPPILASRHTSNHLVYSIQRGEHQPDPESTAPPPYSPPRRAEYRPYVAVYPPASRTIAYQQPLSPGPVSPGMQHAMSSGGIPMAEVAANHAPAAARQAYVTNNYYAAPRELPPRPKAAPVTLADLETPADIRQRAEARRKRREKEDALTAKVGGLWRGRGCFSANGCAGRGGAEGRRRRRWCCCITFGLIVMIIIIVVLAMTLHRKGDNTPVQTQWLNNTGFPPMPTGISTIAQPDAVVENTGCVHPSTMWSCALPKEQQQSGAPNAPNQPNFRLEIRFRNDSSTSNNTSTKVTRHLAHNPVSAGRFIRYRLLHARDVFSSALWSPSPSPPTIEDQRFLGNTTDHVISPLFEGESTPFYISFLPTTPSPSRLLKRQDTSSTNSTADPFPDLASLIPPPSLNSDGTPKPATLLPLPESQPLRLYDRGLQTEHYGFYNYFDRSIFLKSVKLLNNSDPGEVPADMNGGATAGEAKVQCTWAQTRFLVQIWTRKGDDTHLLQNTTSTTTTTTSSKDSKATKKNATNLSANDFSRPGSFPYPVSIVLDRHGGALKEKMVYCYGLDDRGKVVPSDRKFQIEERAFGGVAVNPADGPWGNVTVGVGEGGPGGVDGGDGGCACEWRNWAGR